MIKWYITVDRSFPWDRDSREVVVSLNVAPVYYRINVEYRPFTLEPLVDRDLLIKQAKKEIIKKLINELLETKDWFEDEEDKNTLGGSIGRLERHEG